MGAVLSPPFQLLAIIIQTLQAHDAIMQTDPAEVKEPEGERFKLWACFHSHLYSESINTIQGLWPLSSFERELKRTRRHTPEPWECLNNWNAPYMSFNTFTFVMPHTHKDRKSEETWQRSDRRACVVWLVAGNESGHARTKRYLWKLSTIFSCPLSSFLVRWSNMRASTRDSMK